MIPDNLKDKVYYEEPGIVLLHGDCLEILPMLASGSIQCCVTSPPYWGLRDYGVDGQLGLEETPEAYTECMTEVFKGVNKALRKDGTLWLNLGDSYAHPNTGGHGATGGRDKSTLQSKMPPINTTPIKKNMPPGLKHKDLVGIPWRTAFALQADGWYLRSDIIWSKPNPMPESVTDRPTKAHEYIFLMSKSGKYYYDYEAIKEPAQDWGNRDRSNWSRRTQADKMGIKPHMGGEKCNFKDCGRNKRSVWTITTKPYPGAHFAVFPPELIEPCILAGTKEGDIVLDPFSGSATVAKVCKKLKRRYIGIELNEDYLKLSPDRIGAQGVLL